MLRTPLAPLRAPQATQSTADERKDKSKNPGDRENEAQILWALDTLGGILHRSGKGHAAEVIYKVSPDDGSHYPEHYDDDEVEQWNQQTVLAFRVEGRIRLDPPFH